MNLADYFHRSFSRDPSAVAVRFRGRSYSYGAIEAAIVREGERLRAEGVARGDRVAIWLPKDPVALAVMQAVLRLGASYIPLDPLAPDARIHAIVNTGDCKVVVTTAVREPRLRFDPDLGPRVLIVNETLADSQGAVPSADAMVPLPCAPDELAYILYTSGSTGVPKGVCISHRAAMAFVDWSAKAVAASAIDVFASHAAFHFDLSVFDLYVAFSSGARVVVVPEDDAYVGSRLVDLWSRESISIWYSVPSVMMLMMRDGGLLAYTGSGPRVVVFAGEPFPVPQLRRLMSAFPDAVYWNFFGPTETNVCAAYRLPQIPAEEERDIPIGTAASGDSLLVLREDGAPAEPGEPGELFVEGPTVMLGYAGAEPAPRPYPTGDRVRMDDAGVLRYLGRKDAMLKVRGQRIEPHEVESVLEEHPSVERCAVCAYGVGLDGRLVAFVTLRPGARPPSLLEAKRRCAARLPRAMIVDRLEIRGELPLTRNGKIDRSRLTSELSDANREIEEHRGTREHRPESA